MPTTETVYRKKRLLGMSDAELIEAGKAVLGTQAALSMVCGASEKALCSVNSKGSALPDVVRPLIVRAILRTQRGVAVPELPHVRGRPVSSDVLGSNVSLNLSEGELADFERLSAENAGGQKAVLTGALKRYLNVIGQRKRHEPPAPEAFPEDMRHRRCRIDPDVLARLNKALKIYAPWRSNYLRMAIVAHIAHLNRPARPRAAKVAASSVAMDV